MATIDVFGREIGEEQDDDDSAPNPDPYLEDGQSGGGAAVPIGFALIAGLVLLHASGARSTDPTRVVT